MENKKGIFIFIGILVLIFMGIKIIGQRTKNQGKTMEKGETDFMNVKNRNEIYFAGGCFWGVEGYFKKIPGVLDTTVGYANGKTEETSYRQIKDTDHSETVKIIYDEDKVSLQNLLEHYFRIIDPTSVNKQGNDRGRQYRTGIYYEDRNDKLVIDEIIKQK